MVINPNKPERIFVFIDESGDPGSPDLRDASSFYQLNIVAASRTGLHTISQHLSRFRYFLDADKEFKRYVTPKHKKKLCEIFELCSPSVELAVFHTSKADYTGHYLHGTKNAYSYDPKKFRNYFILKSLEKFFIDTLPENLEGLFAKGLEIELVFDRFLDLENEEQELRTYLRTEPSTLPPFLYIVQVDSEYSDHVQFADYLGKLAKDYLVDGTHDCEMEYIRIYTMDDPEYIKAKRARTSVTDTQPLSL